MFSDLTHTEKKGIFFQHRNRFPWTKIGLFLHFLFCRKCREKARIKEQETLPQQLS